jgi:DNA polymerase III alpha subunit
MIPIFFSHFSMNRSILTLDEPSTLDKLKPISVFTIGKQYSLNEIFLVETSMAGFVEGYKNSKKSKIPIRFGLELNVCTDMTKKDDESLKTDSKVIIWMLNTEGYKDMCILYSKSAIDGFYYHNRLDWKTLNELKTDNLAVSIPFYSSFLHNNLLKGHNCVPEFNTFKPTFLIEKHDLPFDNLITESARGYCISNGFDLYDTHTMYYYAYEDIDAYQTYKCVTSARQRTTLAKPNLSHFSSNTFCWEHFCKTNNILFK